MQYFVTTNTPATEKTDCVVIAIFEQGLLSSAATALNDSTNGRIASIVKRGDITGKAGQTLLLHDIDGVKSPRVLLVGCGKKTGIKENDFNTIITAVTKMLDNSAAEQASLYC